MAILCLFCNLDMQKSQKGVKCGRSKISKRCGRRCFFLLQKYYYASGEAKSAFSIFSSNRENSDQ